jgi:ribulose-phosphate 3-epimerase
MTASIVPTIDATTADDYRAQIQRVANFALRIHIDVADGEMTPEPLVPIADIWWPGGVRADIHVMYKRPMEHVSALIALGPQLVIFHAEAEGDFNQVSTLLHQHGIEAGVALLQDTPVSVIKDGLAWVDHVLVYSGSLGSFGGQADLGLLDKVRELKALKPQLEIGWDGGVNVDNVRQLAEAGVEVLNSGGFIHKAADPHVAYATLESELHKLYA